MSLTRTREAVYNLSSMKNALVAFRSDSIAKKKKTGQKVLGSLR